MIEHVPGHPSSFDRPPLPRTQEPRDDHALRRHPRGYRGSGIPPLQEDRRHGRDLRIALRDLLDLAQLDRRADRILPNGLCLLPPTAACDKGNACLPCGHFATDRSHLDDHAAQRDRIAALVAVRQQQYRNRHGDDMPADNIWLLGRRRELASLDAIITRLNAEDGPVENTGTKLIAADHAALDDAGAAASLGSTARAGTRVVTGAGAAGRTPELIRIDTDGAHAAAMHADLRGRLSS